MLTEHQKSTLIDLNAEGRKLGYDKIKIFHIENGQLINNSKDYFFVGFYHLDKIVYPITKKKPYTFYKGYRLSKTMCYKFIELGILKPLKNYRELNTQVSEFGILFDKVKNDLKLDINIANYVEPKAHEFGEDNPQRAKYEALKIYVNGGTDSKGNKFPSYSGFKRDEEYILKSLKYLDPFNVYTISEANEAYLEELTNDQLVLANRKYIGKIIGKSEREVTEIFKKHYLKEYSTLDFPKKRGEQWTNDATMELRNLIVEKMTLKHFSRMYLKDVNKGDRGIEVLSYNTPETIINIRGIDISITPWNI